MISRWKEQENLEEIWLRVPLSCLVGTALVGFVGEDVAVAPVVTEEGEAVPDTAATDRSVVRPRLVLVCAPQDIGTAASLALLVGPEARWRRHVRVTAVSGTATATDAADDGDATALLLRVALPRAELCAQLADVAGAETLAAALHSTAAPLPVKPVARCGHSVFGAEEPLAGRGLFFSWKTSRTSAGARFALQEWGLLKVHPCRVVALGPPGGIFVTAGCVPLVECPTPLAGACALAMLDEIQRCSDLAWAEAAPPQPAQPVTSTILRNGAPFDFDCRSGSSNKDDDDSGNGSDGNGDCGDVGALAHDRFYEALLRSTSANGSSTRVFGVEIDALCQREREHALRRRAAASPTASTLLRGALQPVAAPHVVSACCADIIARRAAVEGIFRHSGDQGVVRALRALCDRGVPLGSLALVADSHSTVALLKHYLLTLPTAVVPWPVAARLIDVTASSADPAHLSSADVRAVFGQLSPAHLATLRELLLVVAAVVRAQDANKMTPANMAVCIASCLSFRHPHAPGAAPDPTAFEETGALITALTPLFAHASELYSQLCNL